MLIDPMEYVQTPRFAVPIGLSLARSLISRVPADATQGVRRAGEALREQAVSLQSAWIASDGKGDTVDARPVDQATDAAWRGVYLKAKGEIELSTDEGKAGAAAQLIDALYPDGLSFITKRYPQQWAEMEKRLTKLREANLAQALSSVAGESALATLEQHHKAYGETIGVTKSPEPKGPSPNLTTERGALSDKITAYAIAVLAAHDLESEHSANAARQQLAPIDELRAAQRANRAPEQESPEVPIPPLGTAP